MKKTVKYEDYQQLKNNYDVLKSEFDKLQQSIINFQKQLYGKKSERFTDSNQLSFLSTPEPEISESSSVTVKEHTRERKSRSLSQTLPVVEEDIYPETTCSCCNQTMVEFSTDSSERLEHIPAKLFIKRYIRHKFKCSDCNTFKIADLPKEATVIEKSFASASLLASIVVNKYVDHLPLNRQEQIYQRQGVELTRKVMSEWVLKVADLLEPIAKEIKRQILLSDYLQADETPIKVQDREKDNNLHHGYLWSLYSPLRQYVYYQYDPGRNKNSAKLLFEDFAGTIQTDAFSVYLSLANVSRIACLAHVRRKFVESADCKEKNIVLSLIRDLYKVKKENKPADETLEKLKSYLDYIVINKLPKSNLVLASNYAIKQWQDIQRIFQKDEYHPDNNAIERQMA